MIGVGRQARVVGQASVVDAWRTDTTTQVAKWAPVSQYDTMVNEGASVSQKTQLYTRFMEDTRSSFDFYVQLSGPATGRERIRWSIDGADTAFVEFDQTRTNSDGDLELAPIKGRDQIRFRATVKERTGWFAPRRMVLTLDSADQCEIHDSATTLVLIVYSSKAPPEVTITGGPLDLSGGTDSVSFNLVDDAGTAYDMSKLIDTVTAYYRIYDDADDYKTPIPDKIRVDGSANVDPRDQKVTFTSGGSNTQSVTFVAYGGAPSAATLELLVERKDNKYVSTEWNADTGIKNTSGRQIHQDENQWYFSNDYATLRQDNYGLYKKDGWHPGYPTGYGYGGQTLTSTSLPHVEFFEQSATTKVNDPITGNAMQWWVNTDQVTAGPSYTRQLFTVQYCGGPWIGHIPPAGTNFIRCAYRIEPFKTEDVDHQHEIISVGYRARQVARSSSVQFRMRNRNAQTGFSVFGDNGLASHTFEFNGTVAGSLEIDIYDVDGVYRRYKWGGTTAGTTVGVVVPPGTPTAEEIANAWHNAFRGGNGQKITSSITGAQVEVRATEAARVYDGAGTLTARWSDKPISWNTAAWFVGTPSSPGRFKTSTIVDASGNDCRPTAVGGTTGEYYYDEETGTEIWFWSMKNMWGRQKNATVSGLLTNGAPERLTATAWDKWYGVRRDPIWGLTVWMTNYVPDEPGSFDPTGAIDTTHAYRYNDGNSTNVRSFSSWGYSGNDIVKTTAEPGWLIESTETAYLPLVDDGYSTAESKGWDFAGYSKCLMVFNPVWVSNFDGSDDNQSFATVKSADLGTLIHSIQMQIDVESEFYDASTGTWPDFFPAQQHNYWSPRGNCVSGVTSARPTVGIVT